MGRTRTRAYGRWQGERAFIMVWLAMVLVVLLAVAAFAVDLVHAYVVGQQAQNAADAAALGGVVELSKSAGSADGRARDLAAVNGFDPGTEVDTAPSGHNQLTVGVTRHIDTWFAKVLGIDTLTVHRRAIAEYDAPLEMGSPANNLGDIPPGSCPGAVGDPPGPAEDCLNTAGRSLQTDNQHMWAQIQGPDNFKETGNAIVPNYCVGAPTDGCRGTGAGMNNDHDPDNSEYFFVRNGTAGQPLTVMLYDAGFVNTGVFGGSFCDPATNDITNADPGKYYKHSRHCAGDLDVYPSGAVTHVPMTTEYRLFAPDGDSDPKNNVTQVCSTLSIAGDLPAHHGPVSTSPQDLTVFFQSWYPLCTIGAALAGEYVLQVRAPSGSGSNRFSILALRAPGTPPTDDLAVFTRKRLPISVTDPCQPTCSSTRFYLARVLPSPRRDRTLLLDFFDLGDSPGPASSGRATIRPFHTNMDGVGFGSGSPCTYTAPPGDSPADPDPPWGAFTPTPLGPCTMGYDKTTWQAQWVTVRVPIPKSYDCAEAVYENCWVTMEITPSPGSQLADATTWAARMAGGPVRLVG